MRPPPRATQLKNFSRRRVVFNSTMIASTRLVLADGQEMLRRGIRSFLDEMGGLQIVGEAADGYDAIRLARELAPELVISEIELPGVNGIEATRQILIDNPRTRVVLFSSHEDSHHVALGIKAGAVGFVSKAGTGREFRDALYAALRGRRYVSPSLAGRVLWSYHQPSGGDLAGPMPHELLSPREIEVLRLVCEGLTNKQAAERLFISVKTVETYRAQLMDKLEIRTVAGLTKYAIRHGLTSMPI